MRYVRLGGDFDNPAAKILDTKKNVIIAVVDLHEAAFIVQALNEKVERDDDR